MGVEAIHVRHIAGRIKRWSLIFSESQWRPLIDGFAVAVHTFNVESAALHGCLIFSPWRSGVSVVSGSRRISPEDMSSRQSRLVRGREGPHCAGNRQGESNHARSIPRGNGPLILKQLANALETPPDTLERKCALSGVVVDAIQTEMDKERTALVLQLEGAASERTRSLSNDLVSILKPPRRVKVSEAAAAHLAVSESKT